MFEWGSPWWLLGVPVGLAAPWLGRGPRLLFSALDAVRADLTWRVALAWSPKLLLSLGLALLAVGLARPQLVDRERVVESVGLDILLVVDTSGSMEQADYVLAGQRVDRLTAARDVMAKFVEARTDDRIGLVVFGEEAFTQVPLTLDHDALIRFLDLVVIGMAGERATAVGDALGIAVKRLKELDAPSKIVILLTDGRNNAGQVSPLQAAEAAKALGVRVYTIGVGGDGGGGGGGLFGLFSAGRSDLDERTLLNIARTTGGQYYRASNMSALEEVYKTIDQLEKSKADVREYVHREERYRPLVSAALVLLLLGVVLGETAFRRLP